MLSDCSKHSTDISRFERGHRQQKQRKSNNAHTHTHTYTLIHIYSIGMYTIYWLINRIGSSLHR